MSVISSNNDGDTSSSDDTDEQHETFINSDSEYLPPEVTRSDFEAAMMEATRISSTSCESERHTPSKSWKSKLFQATLKNFQWDGLDWLVSIYNEGYNGLLADEMGCGKTVQCLAFIAYLIEADLLCDQHVLIVVPLSILDNWMKEFSKFAPGIHCMTYYGSMTDRVRMRQSITTIDRPQVIITNYETVNRDIDWFTSKSSGLNMGLLVVDEAHRLKNQHSQLYKNLFGLCDRKLLLTGTPLQNNLDELYALLKFTNPTLFILSLEKFIEWYGSGKQSQSLRTFNAENLKRLQKVIHPFILRREKHEVIPDLPVKKQVTLYTGISDIQKKLYKAILKKDLASFDNQLSSSKTSLSNILMQLRKCVNHPYIFPGIEPEPFQIGEHLISASGKLWMLDHLLKLLKQNNHKVLIFSQMTSMLDILQDYMNYRDFKHVRLDGSIRGHERYKAIDEYQSPESDCFAFLLSTRAGGVGLNLCAADTIIFYDSDFNPQSDMQAASRAHRIGQTKPVLVFRLVCRETVEEIILARAQRKLLLSGQLLEKGKFSSFNSDKSSDLFDSTDDQSVGKDELISNIKFGLDSMMANENSTINEDDLNQLFYLKRESVDPKAPEISTDMLAQGTMYQYEGKDYSKIASRDQDAFEKFKLDVLSGNLDGGDSTTTRTHKRSRESSLDEEYARLELERAERRKLNELKRQVKLEKLWNENNYTSLKISALNLQVSGKPDEMSLNSSDTQIQYLKGDVTKPVSPKNTEIIVHSVDNSGKWTDRGLFRSISWLSGVVSDKYRMAHEMKDLHYGDVHLIEVPKSDVYSHCGVPHKKVHVALIVAQKRDRQGKTSNINLDTLERGLQIIGQHALSLNASVHLPRFGQALHDFDWYKTERIIKKQLSDKGIPSFVYYYGKRNLSHFKQYTQT